MHVLWPSGQNCISLSGESTKDATDERHLEDHWALQSRSPPINLVIALARFAVTCQVPHLPLVHCRSTSTLDALHIFKPGRLEESLLGNNELGVAVLLNEKISWSILRGQAVIGEPLALSTEGYISISHS